MTTQRGALMQEQDRSSIPDERTRGDGQRPDPEVFHRAVAVLKHNRPMSDLEAYDALVFWAGQWHTSVRSASIRIIEEFGPSS